MSKDQEIKKLHERLKELEFIKDFQQDLIVEFEKIQVRNCKRTQFSAVEQ